MKNIKNLKVVGLALCMNASILTGCSNKHTVEIYTNLFNSSTITYEENDNEIVSVTGNISYNKIVDSVRVVTFESNKKETTRLVYIRVYRNDAYTYNYNYYDLKTGTNIYSYTESKGEIIDSTNDINLVNKEPFIPYLMEDDNIQYKYDINELIQLYDEKVKSKK